MVHSQFMVEDVTEAQKALTVDASVNTVLREVLNYMYTSRRCEICVEAWQNKGLPNSRGDTRSELSCKMKSHKRSSQ